MVTGKVNAPPDASRKLRCGRAASVSGDEHVDRLVWVHVLSAVLLRQLYCAVQRPSPSTPAVDAALVSRLAGKPRIARFVSPA